MDRIAFRGLLERKTRTACTLLAVILGVALIAGTFILTDTIGVSFDRLVATAGENVDVRVSAGDGDTFGSSTAASTFPASVADRVSDVDGVAHSAGAYSALSVTMVDDRGNRVGPTQGAPTLAFSALPSRFDGFDYPQGVQPHDDGQIAISVQAAKDAGLKLGDRLRVQGTGQIHPYTLVGLTTFGGESSVGGAVFAVLTLADVQTLAGQPGRMTEIAAQADAGVSQTQLRGRIRAAVDGGLTVRTGAQTTADQKEDLSTILKYLTYGLLMFGLIALLVGAFVIFNTFTMTVAQRTREFGMLRTIGASRRQVLWAVVLEALTIGVVGSVLGLLAGIGLAPLLSGLLGSLGFGVPTASLVLATRTIVIAIGLGTTVTLLSSLVPAIRATRVSPMDAMRHGAVRPATRSDRTIAGQAAIGAIGVVVMLVGLFAGLSTSTSLILLGSGAVVVFIGVGMLSPLLVGPLARLIARPLVATGGVAARIARGNAISAPGRTAGTASALMVGIALVAFVAIFVNGFKASFSGAFEKEVIADFVVVDASGLTPETVAPAVARLPGVAAATNLRVGEGKLLSGTKITMAGLDPRQATKGVRADWADGSDETLSRLGARDALLEEGFAGDHQLRIGSPLVVRNAARSLIRLRVRGTYHDRGQLLGDAVIPEQTLRNSFGARTVLATLITVADGTPDAQVRTELNALLDRSFPTLKPQSREEFIDSQVGSINAILYVFYALLALSVIIALFGIVNTLALSVYERTRELGLLRAVGATRRQIRKTVRGEAIITAVMGALLGVAIGVLFGVLVSRPLGDEGFVLALPYLTLAILLIVGALAGVLAAILPARQASRIDVLPALTHQ